MTFRIARNLGANFGRVARPHFNSNEYLTETEMRKRAPSVFATSAHESRSERFKAIPTWEILQALAKEGFLPVGVKESSARDEGKQLFTKHLVRLRKDGDKQLVLGDTFCEALLRNANDGTSSYELLASLFRTTCMNGMVCNVGDIATIKVRHSGDVQAKVIEATYSVIDTSHIALSAPQDWSQIRMEREEREAFAKAAHVLRFADNEGEVHTPVEPAQLLNVRRPEDESRDLWTTFNVVQENVIKGGLKNWVRDESGQRMRRYTSRAVNGIDQDVKLNKALWTLAQEMSKLKKAA